MSSREPTAPADRVRWAIEQSGLSLEAVADRIGCTHSALSQWQTGKTTVANVKAGLLMAFCQVTGASAQWLLSGDGPRLTHYSRQSEEPPLIAAARHIVQDTSPAVAETAYRMLLALDNLRDTPPPAPTGKG